MANSKQREGSHDGLMSRIIRGYSTFLVRFPWVVIILVVVIVAVCGGVSFTQADIPDFGEPIKGFEARGTPIKGAYLGREHLTNILYRRKKRRSLQSNVKYNTYKEAVQPQRFKRNTFNPCTSYFDSTEIRESYMKFVFEGSAYKLFTKESMHAICKFEEDIVKSSEFVDKTCNGLSLGNMIGLLYSKPCMSINDSDVNNALNLLKICAPHYISNTLQNNAMCNIDMFGYNWVYIILHYLTDSSFLNNGQVNTESFKYTILLYHWNVFTNSESNAFGEFYKKTIDNYKNNDKFVRLVAVGADSSDKEYLFEDYLLGDIVLFALAFVLILLIMVLYLRSLTVTVATVFDIIFSFIIAYFLYHIVFRFSFFPFMNVLTGLILIAVGADDVFVFMDIWQQTERDNPEADLVMRLEHTLRHASVSVFVTSLTTATAFLANLVSNITSIKCFGMFSALAIISNFFLMITWVPAIVILLDQCSKYCCKKVVCCDCYIKLEDICHTISTTIFDRFFPYIISKLWFVWIVFVSLLGIGGFVVIFATPKLNLPSSQDFQYFSSNHLLEVYDIKVKKNFAFVLEKPSSDYGLEVHYVFGVLPIDNGNHYNPDKTGSLQLDPKAKLTTTAAQNFVYNFCNDLKSASFLSTYSKTSQKCFLNEFRVSLEQTCGNQSELSFACCGQTWPLTETIFNDCLQQAVIPSYTIGRPYFQSNQLKAFIMTVFSNKQWTASHSSMKTFYQSIQSFLKDRITSGPSSLQKAFVDSSLDFYDLQSSLSSGSYAGVGVSLLCAGIVMFLSTFNILITLYAIITIMFAISITIGALVLLGWQLNVLESITISLAVGMSIDFTIHYGVAYRLSKQLSRSDRTKESFSTVGAAVAMASFTTFIAGACVISSRVLSYSQLGTFLMLVMTSSWFCATFLFQSLCYRFGPQGTCAQIPSPFACCKTSKVAINDNFNDGQTVEKLGDHSKGEGLSNPAFDAEKSDLSLSKVQHTFDEQNTEGNSETIKTSL